MYVKSMQFTRCSGGMSTRNFQTGLRAVLAHRSQIALISAAVARCTTPFSGPTQRSWQSPATISCQYAPKSAVISSSERPITNSFASACAASTHSSLPRPIVNVSPCPWRPLPASVTSVT